TAPSARRSALVLERTDGHLDRAVVLGHDRRSPRLLAGGERADLVLARLDADRLVVLARLEQLLFAPQLGVRRLAERIGDQERAPDLELRELGELGVDHELELRGGQLVGLEARQLLDPPADPVRPRPPPRQRAPEPLPVA